MLTLEQRRALRFLIAKPGAAGTEYAAFAGTSQPAAHNALARLEEVGFVERRRDGNKVRNYATTSGRRALDAPDDVSTRDLVREALEREPDVSRRRLAAQLCVSSTTVQYHVTRLRQRGKRRRPSPKAVGSE